MCAARAREIYEKAAKERMSAGGGDKKSGVENLPPPIENASTARDAAGKAFGVSGKSVDHAKRVIEKGIPELAKAVAPGGVAGSSCSRRRGPRRRPWRQSIDRRRHLMPTKRWLEVPPASETQAERARVVRRPWVELLSHA
jgi:hypothetical protein